MVSNLPNAGILILQKLSSLAYTYTLLRNFQRAQNFILLFPFVLIDKRFPVLLHTLITGNCYQSFHPTDIP